MLVILPLLALASLACFAYPFYVIRPFRHQGARELSAALLVLQIGPWFSILCAALSIALVVYAWPRLRGWLPRTAAVFCILIAALGVVLARFNIYEQLMFRPVARPQFEAANRAQLDPSDMVLALHVNDARRAYPIREIAYHHIVNDTLGGIPVVTTY